ncbi:MAG: choice-of-anchor B family protein [Ignavibacteriae bacterium]|nr:choice-of-anchor B family protein [Ignavibacteriota bacterium]
MKSILECAKRLIAVSSLCAVGVVSVHAQNGVSVIDSLNIHHGGPGPSYGFYYASCWGYVAPDGHEYALIGCYSGTSIIDLDASPIREVAYVPGANSEWKELKTWGHYAYAVSENPTMGLQIIDLSNLPDSAHLVTSLFTIGPRNVSQSHTITVADGYLYLNGGSSNGTTIYSLSNPVSPTYLGQYQPEYVHDCYVRNDTLFAAAINNQNGGGVYIASVVNKATPQQIGHVTYTGSSTHNAWVSPDGRYLYSTDEIYSPANHSLKVFDISNLPSFTPLTPHTFNPATVIHNVHGRGNYVYVAHYKSGVFVGDVHTPAAVTTAGTFNTYRGGGVSSSYAGCWGVYPYFPSGRWIASDTQTGLYLLSFNGLQPRIRSPLLAPADGDTIAEAAVTSFQWRSAASQVEDPHYYQLHIWGSGVDTLIKTRDTSLSVTALPGYVLGQSYRWHVWIKDEYTAVSSQDTFQFVYGTSTVGIGPMPNTPATFVLKQNHPNPFNPSTTIEFTVPFSGRVTIEVFNILGQKVATLVDDIRHAGEHQVKFSSTQSGRPLPSGLYLYRMTAPGGFTDTKKMILLQ